MLQKSAIALSVLALVLGLVALSRGPVTNTVTERLGSVTGPELVGSETWTVNGITHVYKKKTFSSATTTPCSLPYPFGTSTPIFYSVNNGNGTSTAMIYDVSTSTTAYATATSPYIFIFQKSVAGGAYDRSIFRFASTTTAVADSNGSSPFTAHSSAATTSWIVMKTGAGAGGYTIPGASCQAEFIMVTN